MLNVDSLSKATTNKAYRIAKNGFGPHWFLPETDDEEETLAIIHNDYFDAMQSLEPCGYHECFIPKKHICGFVSLNLLIKHLGKSLDLLLSIDFQILEFDDPVDFYVMSDRKQCFFNKHSFYRVVTHEYC